MSFLFDVSIDREKKKRLMLVKVVMGDIGMGLYVFRDVVFIYKEMLNLVIIIILN